ncbi:C-GCAxxG-C-C family protein [Ignavibacterium sp.]|uniref:C-GCAxxG-C-C family protein n=1 Tax=Ignavibacterium sp. TaxID=2651167 RepID=UPI00307D43C5
MKTISERSLELFKSGYYCSESILIAAAEKLGIKSELIPRIASGFGSGIAETNGTCGAVPGAVMAIGLLCGRNHSTENIDVNFQLTKDFVENFKTVFKSTQCTALTKCNLSTIEGKKKFKNYNAICLCNDIVEKSGEILDQIFAEYYAE